MSSPIERELRWTRLGGLALLIVGFMLALYVVSALAFVAAVLAALGGGFVGLHAGMKP